MLFSLCGSYAPQIFRQLKCAGITSHRLVRLRVPGIGLAAVVSVLIAIVLHCTDGDFDV